MVDQTSFPINDTNLSQRIQQTEFYLKEFEKEVTRAQGATGRFMYKEEALSRIMLLNEFAPDDPRVKNLFARAKSCVLGSVGNFVDITPAMTVYLVNEENMRKHYAEISEKAWSSLVAEHQSEMLETVFPSPDPKEVSYEEVVGKCVILDEVMYPTNQFYGATGEYVSCGKRSTGVYFVQLDSRKWLGPYEAVKRYRRLVDATMKDVLKWTVLGRITDITMEVPEPGEKKIGPAVMGWVVEPIALYVPGHVLGVYDQNGTATGRFIGEEEVDGIKESWYTVKSIPEDVTPERLCEIFMYAIKEKNYQLYTECIQPERRETPSQESLMLYYWDLHQERFHGEYVHADFDPNETKITVVKGYDDSKGLDSYFLSAEEQKKISEKYGTKTEYASVQSVAFDENGKQLGSPVRRNCIRTGSGRWYVRDYEIRF